MAVHLGDYRPLRFRFLGDEPQRFILLSAGKIDLVQRSSRPKGFDHRVFSFDPAFVLPVCFIHTLLQTGSCFRKLPILISL